MEYSLLVDMVLHALPSVVESLRKINNAGGPAGVGVYTARD